ncbi:hypothetical protein GW17_00058835 [Ensete ventricosum]|nr:hypothetical protein GW17_00058835 [Ensete ventricosum]
MPPTLLPPLTARRSPLSLPATLRCRCSLPLSPLLSVVVAVAARRCSPLPLPLPLQLSLSLLAATATAVAFVALSKQLSRSQPPRLSTINSILLMYC